MPETQASAAALLAAKRDEIEALHRGGAPAPQTMAALSDLADRVIIELFERELEVEGGRLRPGCVLVALGGYGRSELAPYSDIDLMVLTEDIGRGPIAGVAGRLFRRLWDLNWQVGHSVRSLNQCIESAREDVTIRTALMESRPLAGSFELFGGFMRRFWKEAGGRDLRHYVASKVAERQREIGEYGSTTHLLEPNVKRSKGGLRDLHLIGWIARARWRAASLRELAYQGLFSPQELEALVGARDFLWRIRNELHFGARRAQEVLTFEEQLRVARAFGYRAHGGLLEVERFMQQYHRQTGLISSAALQFGERAAMRSVFRRLAEHLTAQRLGDGLVARGGKLCLDPAGAAVLDGPQAAMRLFRELQRRRLRLDPDLHRALRQAVARWKPPAGALPADVAQAFLALLDTPAHLAETLRLMRSVGFLGLLIPEFSAVQGLMQFNAYHKFTVDEHCLRAVAGAPALAERGGALAEVYHGVRRKAILHLALLLHDIGKGRTEDHCLVGRDIARTVAQRLGLADAETEQLVFLVRHHLIFAHTAFRRDLADQKVLVNCAKTVGSPETLAMLYVLTAADLMAVGPGMFTAWKDALLQELYAKAYELLTGETFVAPAPKVGGASGARGLRPPAQRLDDLLAGGIASELPESWARQQLAYFPDGYLATASRERLADHLRHLQRLDAARFVAHGVFDDRTGLTEYTVYAHDEPGLFRQAAGALTSCGLEIVSAQIWTRPDERIVDIFQVVDPDYAAGPPPDRLRQVELRLTQVLCGELAIEAALASGQRYDAERRQTPIDAPTRVEVDNDTSDRATIIDVFAQNRRGLLYTITKSLFEMGLTIHGARISTHLDQAVDVFYVTDLSGGKITDPERIKALRSEIIAAIDAFLAAAEHQSAR